MLIGCFKCEPVTALWNETDKPCCPKCGNAEVIALSSLTYSVATRKFGLIWQTVPFKRRYTLSVDVDGVTDAQIAILETGALHLRYVSVHNPKWKPFVLHLLNKLNDLDMWRKAKEDAEQEHRVSRLDQVEEYRATLTKAAEGLHPESAKLVQQLIDMPYEDLCKFVETLQSLESQER